MELKALSAISIFLLVYAFLIWDRIDRAVIAILGASTVIILGVITQEEAILGIDFNTIGLLVGMMILVSICQKTGMFQYLAVKSAKLAKGEPWRVLLYLSIVTAVLSGFLDNVTTVLLTVPITLLIVDELKVNPYPFLYAQILAANIGGAATLIGDPPNIMIGSATGFTFMDFVVNMTPAAALVFLANVIALKFLYGKTLKVEKENRQRIMQFREDEAITDPGLLKKCLAILALVVAGFVFQEYTGLKPATVALIGASLLLLISKENPHDIMPKVEWTTIFFFIGLFIIVHSLVEVGFVNILAGKVINLTGAELSATAYYILWLSAIASAFIDNIPFVATMIPLLQSIQPLLGNGNEVNVVWWALSLGACLGGNGTLIGASANVIVAGLSGRSGYPISFVAFLKMAFPLMLMSILICHLYIYLRYLS